jgi:hypothetical protein
MPDQHAPGAEAVDEDDLPPLLAAWVAFKTHVLNQSAELVMDDDMLCFMAGASTITTLVRSAMEQGGSAEASHAFVHLCSEVDSFEHVLEAKLTRNHH